MPRVFGMESAARHGPSIFSALPFPGGKTAGSRWLSAATPPERVSKTSASRRDARLPGDWPPRPAPGCHPIRDGSFREFSGDVAALNPRLPAVKPPASITRKPTGLVKNGFLSAAPSIPNTLGRMPVLLSAEGSTGLWPVIEVYQSRINSIHPDGMGTGTGTEKEGTGRSFCLMISKSKRIFGALCKDI